MWSARGQFMRARVLPSEGKKDQLMKTWIVVKRDTTRLDILGSLAATSKET
jgi:hypothetical protein